MNDTYLNPNYLTRNQAAALCDVHVLTITDWVNSGKITGVKADGRLYILRDSLPTSVIKPSTVGSRLRHARRVSRLSTAYVTQATGINRFTLSKYEHDARPVPALRLSQLAKLYGVSAKWLQFGRDDG